LKPQREDARIAKAVTWFLRDEHLSKQPLNAEMSRRAFTTFLKQLDPMKVYFVQADIDEFSQQQNDIADNLSKKGDVTLAYTIFDRFLQRIDERVALIDQILRNDIDLTVDETIQTDPKTTTYAKNEAETREKWTKRLKYDLLGKKAEIADKDKEKADKAAKADAATQVENTPPKSNLTPQERISKPTTASPSGCIRPIATNCSNAI